MCAVFDADRNDATCADKLGSRLGRIPQRGTGNTLRIMDLKSFKKIEIYNKNLISEHGSEEAMF